MIGYNFSGPVSPTLTQRSGPRRHLRTKYVQGGYMLRPNSTVCPLPLGEGRPNRAEQMISLAFARLLRARFIKS